jgi:hypothetical protein
MYSGDPGESIALLVSGQDGSTTTTDSSGVADITSVVGAEYGTTYDSGNTGGSICADISGSEVCLPSPLTVTGNTDVVIQEQPVIPSAPTNLTISSPTTAPALTWTAVSGATSYNIYRDGTDIGSSTTASYTDTTATAGSHTYYVTAVNAAGESSPSNSVMATVDSVPAISSQQILDINARDQVNFTFTTTGSPTAALTESGALPTGLSFTDNGDGTATLSGQASPVNNGLYALTITATNSAGTATQTFYLNVDDAQTVPTIISTNSLTESYGVPFSFTIDTTGNPLPSISKVSGSGSLPGGVTLKDNGDGTATLSGELMSASDSGTYTFTIKATNKNGTVDQPFTLTVTKTPVIKSISNKTVKVGNSFSQAVSATGDPTPSLSASGFPSGLSFTDNGDGTGSISGTPGAGSAGSYTVTITATNAEGSSTESFILTVKP